MKKILTISFCLIAFCNEIHSQNPFIAWQRLLGGSSTDQSTYSSPTSDGGIIIAGQSYSNNGNVSGNHGSSDYWLIKLNRYGGIVWQHCYGGTGYESAESVQETNDGGFIVVGETNSNNGDVSGNHGGDDFWVLKTDNIGNIQWQKCYGGTGDDWAHEVKQTTEGGFIVAGQSNSNNGDVTGNHGGIDFWVVKLNTAGIVQWQKSYGGALSDVAQSIEVTSDSGYIISGRSQSNNGDVTGNHSSFPNSDFWVIKIDSVGLLQWQKCLGGTYDDEAFDAKETEDGEFVIVGKTSSSNGDVSGYHGLDDCWVVKLSNAGSLVWQKCFGGTAQDWAFSIFISNDKKLFVSGRTQSNNGDVTGNHGADDIWLLKIDTSGNLINQVCIGGSSTDVSTMVFQLSDNYLVLSGQTASSNFDVKGEYHGGNDYWILKIRESNYLHGLCYIDYNQNGVKDSTDIGYDELMVQSTGNGITSISRPNLQGEFSNFCDTGSIVTTITNLLYYTFSPQQYITQHSTSGNIDSLEFALTPSFNKSDVLINAIPLGAARTNDDLVYRVTFKNIGTDTSQGNIYFTKYPPLIFIGSTIPYDVITGDTIIWSYSELAPAELRYFDVNLFVPSGQIILGDTLSSEADISSVEYDLDSSNNHSLIDQVVTGSNDPNDKEVTIKPIIPLSQVISGAYIPYVIRFQNTGTDTAFNILVRDTLDSLLDWNSFEMLSSSHNCDLNIEDSSHVLWSFNNIILPDSNTNEPESHGYIFYKIKPLNSLSPGTVIHNTASIFFDYNDPVKTNDASVIINCNIDSNSISTQICEGDSLYVGGEWQHQSGIYNDIFSGVLGCDSFVETHLNVIALDDSVILSLNQLTALQSNVSYQWIDCGNNQIISGATNQTFTPLENGIYAAVLTSPEGCIVTTDCTPVLLTNTFETNKRNRIILSPVPSSTNLKIEYSLLSDCKSKIDLCNVLGLTVVTLLNADQVHGDYSLSFDVSSIDAGIYFIKFTMDGVSSLEKFIKM